MTAHSLDDLPPGNYLLTKLPDGHRVWNAASLATQDTGNDAGDPAFLLGIYFHNLNTQTDEAEREMHDGSFW